MALRAKLDADNVYWGPEEVAELGPDDVSVPDEVIRPGAYRWALPDANHPQARWEPLPPTQVKKVESAPSLEQAFYEYLREGPESAHVRAWMKAFEETIDGRGRNPK